MRKKGVQRSVPQPLKKRAQRRKQKPMQNMEGKKLSKGPRFCPEHRLQSRLYEPLVLLHVLDRNGERRSSHISDGPASRLQDLRRSFLNELAYICDHIKGGDTVTAVALESQPSGTTFWVTANESPSRSTQLFLKEILDALRTIAFSSSEHPPSMTEDEIARKCIEFGLKRIIAYCTLMRKPFEGCVASLRSLNEEGNATLADWLEIFQSYKDDLSGLCYFAYEQRSCQHMIDLRRHIGDEPADDIMTESKKQLFLLTRHYIGRLGSHIKAAKILVAAASRMPDILANFTIKTRPSPKPPSLPPPTDHLTTLSGIIRRMLPAHSSNFAQFNAALAKMDAKFNIQDRLQKQFQAKDFRPRVHAELSLLEFFYTNRLPFVADDRFIGCSKPACYCCYHYISLHPGGFARPSSHGNRYLSWRPPDLTNPEDEREKKHQLDVLNKLIAQIQLDALRQIEQRKGPSPWHPDSSTGITYSQEHNAFVGGTISQASQRLDDALPISKQDKKHWIDVSTGGHLESDLPSSIVNDPKLCGAISNDESSDSDGGALLSETYGPLLRSLRPLD